MAASMPQPIRRGFTFAHGPEWLLTANVTEVKPTILTVGTCWPLVVFTWMLTINTRLCTQIWMSKMQHLKKHTESFHIFQLDFFCDFSSITYINFETEAKSHDKNPKGLQTSLNRDLKGALHEMIKEKSTQCIILLSWWENISRILSSVSFPPLIPCQAHLIGAFLVFAALMQLFMAHFTWLSFSSLPWRPDLLSASLTDSSPELWVINS